MPSKTDVQEILVLEPDRLRGAVLARTISRVFPCARVYCESNPTEAASVLAHHPIELFIVALRGFDLDIITLLGVWAEHDTRRTRVLVVTPEANSPAMMAVRRLPITGVFDSSRGNLRELEVACRAVLEGTPYVSKSVTEAAEACAAVDDVPADDSVEQPDPRHETVTTLPRLAPPVTPRWNARRGRSKW